MTISQHRHLVLDAAQRTFDILVGIGCQGFAQVVGDPIVVDHDAAALAETSTVDPRNGLKQLGLLDWSVKVHHPFDGGVKAGEQHRLNDQEGQRICLARLLMIQRLLEALDQLFVLAAIRPSFPLGRIVI
ncbi:hypothetical protein D3C81_1336420 [compost metagenome]